MYNDELYHHGIVGMKWGVRRYQNKDGSYTILGKVRRRDGSSSSRTTDRLFTPSIKKGKDKAPVSPAEAVAKEATNITSRVSSTYNRFSNIKNARKPRESKQLSDAELRKRIQRFELEHRYEKLKSEDVDEGRITVGDILDTVGDVATASLSAIAIYVALKYR